MSKLLKFRAWDKKYKHGISLRHIKIRLDGKLDLPPHHEGENVILEQYTGLKDRKGKEIYEGDIVYVVGIGIAQVIDSPSGEWMLCYMREPDEINNGFVSVIPKNKPSGLWKTNTTNYIEIIGNIHENPEYILGGKE